MADEAGVKKLTYRQGYAAGSDASLAFWEPVYQRSLRELTNERLRRACLLGDLYKLRDRTSGEIHAELTQLILSYSG